MRVLKSIARLVVGALAVCACAAAPLASRPAVPRGPRPTGPIARRPLQPVPAPFQSAVPAMVSIVTADIDGDGDLDVVASDSELQLYVWLNDGFGHFVRQRPTSGSRWRREGAAPSLEHRGDTTLAFAQTDRAPLGGGTSRFMTALASVQPAVAFSNLAIALADRSRSTPRAPPTPPRLA